MKVKNNDFTSIIPKDIRTGSKKYYCSLCNCNLSLLNGNSDEFWCNRCNVSYFPDKEKVKRANRFETPHGPSQPIVSMVDDTKRELSSSYKTPKLSPYFRELIRRPGVNLIDYQTTEE